MTTRQIAVKVTQRIAALALLVWVAVWIIGLIGSDGLAGLIAGCALLGLACLAL